MSLLSADTGHALRESPLRLPSVNLLPPEMAEHRRFRQAQAKMGVGVLAAFVVVGLLYVSTDGAVSAANSRLAAAGAQHSRLQAQTGSYRGVTATYAKVPLAEALLSKAMGQEVRYSGLLNQLSATLPPNVWITNVAVSQTTPGAAATSGTATSSAATSGASAGGIGSLTVTGTAYSHDDVANWLDTLASTPTHTDPLLSSSTAAPVGSRTLVTFSTTVTLTPAALSGRYPATGG